MPSDASQLYARNVTALLQHLAPGRRARARLRRRDHRRRVRRRGKEVAGVSAPLVRDRAHDPRARDLPRLRGDLEGADDAAHAADVGHERDPRDRDRRRDPRRRPAGRGHARRGSSASSRSSSATANVVGGFVVTDRMLEMFKRRKPRREREPDSDVLYLVTIVSFILALRFLSSPAHARGSATRSARPGWRSRSSSRSPRTASTSYGWIAIAMADRRRRRRRRRAPREDDRDAADGGAVQRRRRRRGGADRARRVPQPRAGSRAGSTATSRSRSSSRR